MTFTLRYVTLRYAVCTEMGMLSVYSPIQEVLQHAGIFVNVYYSHYGQWSFGVYWESKRREGLAPFLRLAHIIRHTRSALLARLVGMSRGYLAINE